VARKFLLDAHPEAEEFLGEGEAVGEAGPEEG
jgi:hypothetical protein